VAKKGKKKSDAVVKEGIKKSDTVMNKKGNAMTFKILTDETNEAIYDLKPSQPSISSQQTYILMTSLMGRMI
jgi:hypothetical protein